MSQHSVLAQRAFRFACLFLSVASVGELSRLNAQAVNPPASIPASLSTLTQFQQKAVTALSPTAVVFSRVTLNGNVTRKVGPASSSGNVTLTSGTDGYVNEQWNVSGATKTIAKTAFATDRVCTLSLNGGPAKPSTGMDCARSIPWFAPWQASPMLVAGRISAIESAGESGSTRQTYPVSIETPTKLNARALADFQRSMSAENVDVLYDSATALPSGMHYTDQLSSEAKSGIDESVVYSDYRLDQGLMIPHRIQRYVQRALESDITITSVVL